MKNKQNVSLIVGILVPLLIIGAIAAVIYSPGSRKKPQYDFIYSGDKLDYKNPDYVVLDNKIDFQCNEAGSFQPIPIDVSQISLSSDKEYQDYIADQGVQLNETKCTEVGLPKLYYYSVANEKSTEISLVDAKRYTLRKDAQSLDGFTIERGSYNQDIISALFGGSSQNFNLWFANGNNRLVKLNVITNEQTYSSLNFRGWIEK